MTDAPLKVGFFSSEGKFFFSDRKIPTLEGRWEALARMVT
jgi:hypothetical protein